MRHQSASATGHASFARRTARAGVLVLLLGLLPACRSAFEDWDATARGPYDALPEAEWRRFEAARADFEQGNLRLAREGFARLAEAHPDHLPSLIWLQESELALAGEEASDAKAVAEEARIRYRTRADREESPTALVLAARVETDPFAALALLRRAVQRDPSCAWAHYGLAWWLARQREWSEARKALGRCLELAPGHLEARRLEAWLLARAGKFDDAAEALTLWIEHAQDEPRISPERVRDAELELALISALQGRPGRALELLDRMEDGEGGLPGEDEARATAFALRAAALRESGRPRAALEAARRAHEAAPEETLPLVQEALLHELWLDEPREALAAWEAVLAQVEDVEAISGAVERARAAAHAQRLRARLGLPPRENAAK